MQAEMQKMLKKVGRFTKSALLCTQKQKNNVMKFFNAYAYFYYYFTKTR